MSLAKDICLTVDLRSSQDMRSFMGITSHFTVDYTLQSVMLACRQFHGSHTADKIYEVFEEIVSVFDINSRISTIVTDNAASMVKAFSLPGSESLCVCSDEEDDQDDGLEEVVVADVLDYLPSHRSPCFAHTLQLVVKDSLEQAGQLKNVIAKVGALVSHVHHSTRASDLFSSCVKLQPSNQTKWNSQLKML